MKSIEELMAIRDKTRKNMTVREDTGDSKIRVVVGMATCGIAAGGPFSMRLSMRLQKET